MGSVNDLIPAITGYADRFHRRAGVEHHVASPLGAWLLLALAGTAATGPDAAALADTLGMNCQAAADQATRLLSAPHPALSSAAAVWRADSVRTPELERWLGSLAAAVEVGPVPTQVAADAWADRVTAGLIPMFPVDLDGLTVLVLATVLATRGSWNVPFQLAPGADLGPVPSSWTPVAMVLRSAARVHDKAIVATADGDMAVHCADTTDGLAVVSVAAGPAVPAPAVLMQAHRIASGLVAGPDPARRSLFDLPLGAGAAWTITEREEPAPMSDGRVEQFIALLPAWQADTTLDLARAAGLGFDVAAHALSALLPPDPRGYTVEAKQAAMARYHRFGFEAAAVTAMALRASAMAPGRKLAVVREATLRFARPYAVVAVARDRTWSTDQQKWTAGPWHGVPAFSAWVDRIVDADVPDGEGS